MNPEEEDDYEPAFVDASAADVTVHLDLNETDEPPPPDDDDDPAGTPVACPRLDKKHQGAALFLLLGH